MYAPYARLKRKNSGRSHNHRRPDFYSSLLRVPELPQTIRCPRFFLNKPTLVPTIGGIP